MNKNQIAKEIAGYLLEVEAVKLSPNEPFTWASGWKSPIYCDNRVTLSFPHVRERITKIFAELIRDQYAHAEAVVGVATAGIPQAALIAAELGLPMAYVRAKPKAHGMGNQIEGRLDNGQKVIVIEDLISTGGSSLAAISSLKQSGIEVLGLAAIFTYGFDLSVKNFADAGVIFSALSDYAALIDLAKEKAIIKAGEADSLSEWRKDPSVWGK